MLWIRRALAAGALLMAGIFCASVVCPRLDERPRPVPPPPELDGALPAALSRDTPQPLPVSPERTARSGERAPAAPELLVQVLDAERGQGLAAAELELRWLAADGERVWTFSADEQGFRRVLGVESARCTVLARQVGYLPAPAAEVAVRGGEQEIVLPLQAGALISGSLRAADGSPLNFGLLRALRDGDGDDDPVTVKPGHRGAFAFAALPAGTWTIDWLEQVHAEPDARHRRSMVLEAHQHYELEMVVDVSKRASPNPLPLGVQVIRVRPF